ncbi:uncharacterized protein PV07_05990 [Cladophialophora immunda]|uniref:Peptidase S33 tripeptidyl aminopeptidase-like C-terminal domain-containing protein n=1 Tax=Cladophialophora immunda TaxID=569365 RepID=A0A0D1ZQD1_9EURO|nr:uncharacterized protein PV07_05990 [Cladophialophora immunda]KIW30231.1 hypothetical protein PV07_05990 [Cladophialophora immunda]
MLFRFWSSATLQHYHPRMDAPNSTSLTNSQTRPFTWSTISPSKRLVYHPCFDGFQCARLDVPLDWNSTVGSEQQVAIAIVKLPARVPVTDPRYGGVVLLNPGGPGASGVDLCLRAGKPIQQNIDSEVDPSSNIQQSSNLSIKYFDVLGFDPCGVNNTSPRFECFTNFFSRQSWTLFTNHVDVFGSSDTAFDGLWARTIALAHSCSDTSIAVHNGHELQRFTNTAPVVTDMVEIMERHGEWREQEARSRPAQTSASHQHVQSISDQIRRRRGEKKLLYWGSRMELCSVHPLQLCILIEWAAWSWTVYVMQKTYFVEAGRQISKTPIPSYTNFAIIFTKPAVNDARFMLEAVLQKFWIDLKTCPLAVKASPNRGPDVITYSDVMRLIRVSLYSPPFGFPIIARFLDEISRGNGSGFADYKQDEIPTCQSLSESDPQERPEDCPDYDQLIYEVADSIICTDAEDQTNLAKSDFRDYLTRRRNQSKWLGDLFSVVRLPCFGWQVRPSWRFSGPISGDPAHPLLFIGNTFDPVTPIHNIAL